MPFKSRTESKELLILKSLNTRMSLPEKDKQHYLNIKKGFDGEVRFDTLTEKLQCECYIINDLLLKHNHTLFQIDTLIIFSDGINFFEVKNHDGDYYYESGRLYKKPRSEIINPHIQLKKDESLLRQLLQKLGFNLPVNGSVVFINPEFTLYQAPLDQPFIFPTQIKNHLQNLGKKPSKLTAKHKQLAEKLVSLHITDSPYTQIPEYTIDKLQKGITCKLCDSFSVTVEGRKCVCHDCGFGELVEEAVIRSVDEIKLLFPDLKITTNLVYEWCKVIESKRRIARILEGNFKKVGVHQWASYE